MKNLFAGVVMQELHVSVFLRGAGQYHVDIRRRLISLTTTNLGSLQERSTVQAVLFNRLGYASPFPNFSRFDY